MTAIFSRIMAFFMSILMFLFPSFYPQTRDEACSVKGSELTVSLASNPSTGCTWKITNTNEKALVLKNKTFKSRVEPGGDIAIVGAGGTDIYVFKAIAAGEATLIFEYGQHWEGGEIYEVRTVVCRINAEKQIELISNTTE